jgi:peptide/nickel transport system substrate-binding protein
MMIRTYRSLALLFILGLLFSLAAACGPAATPAPAKGGIFTQAVNTDPETMDLQVTSNPAAYTVFSQIYDTLVYQDYDGSYKGYLAESWIISPDGLSITFKLRKGIKFTDGSPFNAQVVKFTFERLQKVGTKSPIYEMVKGFTAIDVVDDATVKITLKEPTATIWHDFATAYAGILSPTAVEKAGDNYGRQPVGTGPYKLKEWQTGQLVVLEANADYAHPPTYYTNKKASFLKERRYKVIPEAATRMAALEAGEIDMVGLEAKDFPKYSTDPRFRVYTANITGITYLGFTCVRPPFDNPKMRQAMAHAVNKKEIVDVVFEGKLAVAIHSPLPPSIQGYSEKLKEFEYKYDLEKAQALFAELGYKPGATGILEKDGKPFRPVLYTTTDSTRVKIATILQAQYKKVGVDLQIKTMESGTLLKLTPAAEHDLLLLGYNWGEPDALFLFLHSSRTKSSNRVHYISPAVDKLLEAGRREMDQAKRMQIYFDAQKQIIQDAPWQSLFMPLGTTAIVVKVKDVKVHPNGDLLFHDAYVEGK